MLLYTKYTPFMYLVNAGFIGSCRCRWNAESLSKWVGTPASSINCYWRSCWWRRCSLFVPLIIWNCAKMYFDVSFSIYLKKHSEVAQNFTDVFYWGGWWKWWWSEWEGAVREWGYCTREKVCFKLLVFAIITNWMTCLNG